GAGEYSIDGGAYTGADGTINGGQQISVRLTSADTYGKDVTTRLIIGGVGATFRVTTKTENVAVNGGGGGESRWLLPLCLALLLRKRISLIRA
ncbi:MAG TPA: hypothetical protein VGL10_06005, partial [Gammaproteobacteria bacterium]